MDYGWLLFIYEIWSITIFLSRFEIKLVCCLDFFLKGQSMVKGTKFNSVGLKENK